MKRSHRTATPAKRFLAQMEALENRRLLSAVLAGNGTLTLTSTVRIDVQFSRGDKMLTATTDGTPHTFSIAAAKKLVLIGAAETTVESEPGPADAVLQNVPIFISGGNDDCTIVVDLESETGVRLNVNGGNGSDTIGIAAAGFVTVHGGTGDDSISVEGSGSGPINAVVFGDAGNDTLSASGNDRTVVTLFGGAGNDLLLPGYGVTAALSGGTGTDAANLSNIPGNQRVFMDGSQPSTDSDSPAAITFDGTVENLIAGAGNDLIVGTPANNLLTAGTGNDTLAGMAGNDTLTAGTGIDSLLGGDGNDVITSTALKYLPGEAIPAGGPNFVDGGSVIDTAYTRPADNVTNVETNVNGNGVAAIGSPATGTAGSYHALGNTVFNTTDGDLGSFFDSPTASGGYVEQQLSNPESISQISFAPRPGFESRMVGGIFQGSDAADFSSGVTTLYTITAAPAAETLTPVSLHVGGSFLYVRYVGPAGGYCNIAEMRVFGAPSTTGAITGTVVNDLTGDGSVEAPLAGVTVYVDLKNDGKPDPGDPTGVTDGDGGYTLPSVPAGIFNEYEILPSQLSSVGRTQKVQNIDVGPGDHLEIDFVDHRQRLLTGTVTGNAGSYDDAGDTIAGAVDGSLLTFFDGPNPSGNTITIDLGRPTFIDRVSYAPRTGFAQRMVGGYFEFSTTADFGSYEFMETVETPPETGSLTTVTFSLSQECRYVRYVSPVGSYGNIAEFQVWG